MRKDSGSRFLSSKIFSVLTGILVLLGFLIVFTNQYSQNISVLQTNANLFLRTCSSETQTGYNNLIYSLEYFVKNNTTNRTQSDEEWVDQAAFFVQLENGIDCIAWLDTNRTIKKIVQAPEYNFNINQNAEATNLDTNHMTLWIPGYVDGNLDGFLFVILRVDKLIVPSIDEIENKYLIRIDYQGSPTYVSKNWSNTDDQYVAKGTIVLKNTRTYELSVAPTVESINTAKWEPVNLMLFGIFLSIIISASIRFAQKYMNKTKVLELSQKALDHYRTQLEEKNAELESFNYSVSHDLRAPLRHIAGYLELFKKRLPDSIDEKGKHYIHIIDNSTKQMGQLIDDLLEFSRIGNVEIKSECVNTNDIVRRAILSFQNEIADRKIKWIISDLPDVYGDANLLYQVFINLISNSIKYTLKKPLAEICIGVTDEKLNNNKAVFFIKDNGVGFDMQYYDKLFAVFQRLHRQEDFDGTGIGLANVHRILRRHGNEIWATSKVDEGAIFYFTLKLKEE